MTDDHILALICSSSGFTQIQCRETEMTDLDLLMSECMRPLRGGGLAAVQCLEFSKYINRLWNFNSSLRQVVDV
uniref:SEC63 domain-containing protein n=2 Tax=Bursaphelenchus xylophilus TaxID=6326 RepID=A0A1I7SIH2_BURXY